MSKELKNNEENMKNLQERMSKAEDHIQKLQEELQKLSQKQAKTDNSNSNSNSNANGASNVSGVSDKEFEDLKKNLKERIDVINQKMGILQDESNHHDQEIGYLKDLIESQEEK
jgi:chromosome segregation ATPase